MVLIRLALAVGVAGGALAVLAASSGGDGAPSALQAPEASRAAAETIASWRSFVSPAELATQLDDPRTLVIDVRKADAYASGHVPGSISIPGDAWRTPSCKPGSGDSQYVFRLPDGTPDVARYERLLGDAGVTRAHRIVVVGNHAGKADGSVPAMILDWLGHADVRFLDGVGVERWKAEGLELATVPERLAPATYEASPRPRVVWNLSDVLRHLVDEDVVFLDTRSAGEFDGSDRRDNRYGGRIPGAVRLDYAELLAPDKTSVDPATARGLLAERGVTRDKTVVLYCQTATRVSLPYLMLRDLGFERIAVYDASWHEYGNRDDTPIEARTGGELAAR